MQIMIVDDNAEFRASLRMLLCSCAHKLDIVEVVDGFNALLLVESERPDLIFIDVGLPDGTGMAVTRKIKQEFPTVPVAILTSYDLLEYRQAADDSGADYYFGKSEVTARILTDLVETHADP